MADWSQLPYDIIHKVTTCLTVIEDFLAFSAVCCSWRSVYLAKQWHPGPQVPVLIFSEDQNSITKSFLSLYRYKVSNLELPEVHGRRCWDSSSGWLVTIGNDHEIRLLNPITRVSYNLPPKSSLRIQYGEFLDWYDIIERAFVFRNPCASNADEDLVVMIIYGVMKQLAFCRPGYSSWRCMKEAKKVWYVEVTCVKDQIFAFSLMGDLDLVDIDTMGITNVRSHMPPADVSLSFLTGGQDRLSLVKSSGDLWMVCRIQKCGLLVESVTFLVYKFDFDKGGWIRLSNLGGRTIFVSDHSCIAVSAAHDVNCESNCIYFVASKSEKQWPYRVISVNVGVYSLRTNVSRPLCPGSDIQKKFSFPLWVIPTLK